MSRGPGRVQRAILGYLRNHDVADVREIAVCAEQDWDLPDRVMKSYQRAMRTLEKAGKVKFDGFAFKEYNYEQHVAQYGLPEVVERRFLAKHGTELLPGESRHEFRARKTSEALSLLSVPDCNPEHRKRLDELAERETRIARAMGGRP